MTKLLEMLRKQDGRYSIGRVCTVVTFVLWVFTWLYTLFLKMNYAHFETVTIAMLILFFVVLMGKAVDSRIVSIKEDKQNENLHKSGTLPRA